MGQPTSPQLNVRSRFARERAAAIARATGMTVTQVIEEALRAYQPAGTAPPPGRLVRKGKLLVMPARRGRAISAEETQRMIDEDRSGVR